MKIRCYKETDSLYIDLVDRPSAETKGISEGINLDYDDTETLVGIDIDLASQKLDLSRLELGPFPEGTKIIEQTK